MAPRVFGKNQRRKCKGCGDEWVEARRYLGPRCWEQLAIETRRRLSLRDGKALERYMVLIDQLENRVPLDLVVVPA